MIILFIRYFWAVIVHKFCILLAGIRINKILRSTPYQVSYKRLILHDLSKFSRSEFWPYAEHFYGEKKNAEAFHQAWLHHVRHNDHHWEHFIEDYPSVSKILWKNDKLDNLIIHEMPDDAILEMVADNLAATRSYEGYWPNGAKKDGWSWMTESFDHYRLHPITRLKFTAFLCALDYARVLPQEFDWKTIEKANISNEEKKKLSKLQQIAQLNN
ncbi:unnamed protein product [Adineta steineri]|uniref:Uncharacterized protein n=1 Tax=Adineta steineri TaxID=433720 RepID=A0A815ERY8_9BILA|nr:unnamed protein product [Adineta steineri]CAF3558085.1 unnamed protein product [Adineta steineri]